MIKVTKKELENFKNINSGISIGDHDKEWLKQFKDEDHVGYIAGDLDNIASNNKADLWFINKDFFDKNYKEV